MQPTTDKPSVQENSKPNATNEADDKKGFFDFIVDCLKAVHKQVQSDAGWATLTAFIVVSYALAKTLGSGSYADLLTDYTPFLTFALWVALFIFYVLSFSGLCSILARHLDLKTYEEKFPTRAFNVIKACFWIAAFLLLALAVNSAERSLKTESLTPHHGHISIVLYFLIAIVVLCAMCCYVYGMMKENGAGLMILVAAITVAGSAILLNTFRDAQKDAYITDSRYCAYDYIDRSISGRSERLNEATCEKFNRVQRIPDAVN